MARPWERLFVAAARLFAWCVILTPFAVVAVVVAAALAGQQEPDTVLFLGNLIAALFATLLVAVVGAVIGASVGIGTALLTHELLSGKMSRLMEASVFLLSAFPAVVVGWFGATLVLPALFDRAAMAVFAAAAAVVTVAVIPRAHTLATRCLGALAPALRETAAAAGARPARITAHVTLPACARSFMGIYGDSFSRAVGEASAVAIVFLAAARAGYPVLPLTIPSSILLHARSVAMIDAGIAQSAVLIVALAVSSKALAVRRIGELQWV